MKTIWKFKLPISDTPVIQMPHGAEVISAGFQGEELFVWALVDAEEFMDDYLFYIFGTGHPVQTKVDMKFVDTVFFRNLVFHVFIALKD